MPNIVETCYILEGPKETLQKIYDAIKHSCNCIGHHYAEDDNRLEGLNLPESVLFDALNIKYPDDYYLRGWIQVCELDSTLYMYAEEAWGLTDFAGVLMANITDIKIYYQTIDRIGDGSVTNDVEGKYFPEKFLIDTAGCGETHEFDTKEAAYAWLEECTGCKNKDDVKLFNDKKHDSDQKIYIAEIKVVDVPLIDVKTYDAKS